MVDFDTLLNGPVAQTFGQASQYLPQGAPAPFPILAVPFEGYLAVADDGLPPPPQSRRPHVGVQVSQILALWPSWDAQNAQGDKITYPDGRIFVVKSSQPDGTGWCNLELQIWAPPP